MENDNSKIVTIEEKTDSKTSSSCLGWNKYYVNTKTPVKEIKEVIEENKLDMLKMERKSELSVERLGIWRQFSGSLK